MIRGLLRREPSPPKCPGGTLLGGNLDQFANDALRFYEQCEHAAGITAGRAGIYRGYVVTDPDLISEILRRQHKSFVKGLGLEGLGALFGRGLLTSEGELWKRQRKLLSALFLRARVEDYRPTIRACIGETLATMRDGDTRNIYGDMTRACLEALSRMLLGRNGVRVLDAVADIVLEIQRYSKGQIRWQTRRGARARFLQAIARFDEAVFALIEKARLEGTEEASLVGLLLDARGRESSEVTEIEIRDQLVTMILAGFETTASAIAWTLDAIAREPEVQERLHAELRACPQPHAAATNAAPRGLGYLEKVVLEGLRLYPSVHRLSRRNTVEVALGRYRIPRGREFVIPQWAVHRSSRYFPEPHRFVPDRWSNAMKTDLPEFAYFPFGGGPRSCIGASLAMVEAEVIIGEVLKQFRLEPVGEQLTPFDGVTLTPPDGVLPILVRRRRAA